MPGDQEFQQRMQLMDGWLRDLEEVADPALRAKLKGLIQCVMELHGACIEKALEIIFQSGEAGERIIDQLGRDPLVGNLLVLHDLHPKALETRVEEALDRVRPQLRKKNAEVELIAMSSGTVRLRVQVGDHACGSTLQALRATLDDAIYEAAPDVNGLEIEGLEGKPASGFLSLDALLGSHLSPALSSPVQSGAVALRGHGAD